MKTNSFSFPAALLLLSCFAHLSAGKPVIVSLPGRSVQLRGEVGDFGYQFDSFATHPANLLLAPEEDPYLCSYPSSLEGVPPRSVSSPASPIALFVSRGECSFEQKASVALALQQNFTQELLYIIVYNNDRNNPSQVIRMGGSTIDIPSMGFLAVSTRAGSYTLSSMYYVAERRELNPYLGKNVSDDWNYPIQIEQYRSYAGTQAGSNTFYLLRFILFALLILAPCFRAVYLWFNGGGRIQFRRNERGLITGLQIIRPVAYWFSPSAQEHVRPERSQLLTEAQVRALPEITYVRPPDLESTDEDDTSVESGDAAAAIEKKNPTEDAVVDSSEQAAAPPIDEELGQAQPGETNPEELTTSCTTCSICIDDFENGERIRVLPKCRHAFHTDCLMPWLTERQGCCPLCKRSVLDEDNTNGPEADGDENRQSDAGEQGTGAESDAGGEPGVAETAYPTSQAEQMQEEVVPPLSLEEEIVVAPTPQEALEAPVTDTEREGSEQQIETAKADARLNVSPV